MFCVLVKLPRPLGIYVSTKQEYDPDIDSNNQS